MKSRAKAIEAYVQRAAQQVTADSIEPLRRTLQQWRESVVVYSDNKMYLIPSIPPSYKIIHPKSALSESYRSCRGCPLAVTRNWICHEAMEDLIGRIPIPWFTNTCVILPDRSRSIVYRFLADVINMLERIIELYTAGAEEKTKETEL